LSKLLSGILRHFPHAIGLKVDEHGFVDLDELVHAIKTKWRARYLYSWLRKEHIIALAQLDPKGRFEIVGNRIRARYGHSIKVKIEYVEAKNVEVLYHGTALENLSSILQHGIKPMRRLWVHLTSNPEDAYRNALRKSKSPVVLVIDAKLLNKLGHRVYKAGKNVYVTDYVPPSCIIRVVKNPFRLKSH